MLGKDRQEQEEAEEADDVGHVPRRERVFAQCPNGLDGCARRPRSGHQLVDGHVDAVPAEAGDGRVDKLQEAAHDGQDGEDAEPDDGARHRRLGGAGVWAAPGAKDEPGFDPDAFSLIPLPVDTWGPFIFVNPDRQTPPLADLLGALPGLVAATGLDLGANRRRVRRTDDIAANWKVVVDNYLECYHCPVAHPGFCDLIDVND
jgi:hypothetical protein